MTGRPRGSRTPAALLAAAGLLLPGPLPGQARAKPPAEVADEYLRGIEAMAWRATAQRIHPDALAEVRDLIEIFLAPEVDRDGAFLEALSGGQDGETFLSLDDGSLFVSAMRALTREAPGIVNAMTARRTDVIGTVTEADTLTHAVYRLHWELSGAEPEMKVLSLARDARGRWRVREAPELASLRPAIRALGRRVRPPPP